MLFVMIRPHDFDGVILFCVKCVCVDMCFVRHCWIKPSWCVIDSVVD